MPFNTCRFLYHHRHISLTSSGILLKCQSTFLTHMMSRLTDALSVSDDNLTSPRWNTQGYYRSIPHMYVSTRASKQRTCIVAGSARFARLFILQHILCPTQPFHCTVLSYIITLEGVLTIGKLACTPLTAYYPSIHPETTSTTGGKQIFGAI